MAKINQYKTEAYKEKVREWDRLCKEHSWTCPMHPGCGLKNKQKKECNCKKEKV